MTGAEALEKIDGRPLGGTQRSVLRCLGQNNGGKWWVGCGWVWSTPSGTATILMSLVRRGLAEIIRDAPDQRDRHYKITASGVNAAAQAASKRS